MDAELGFIADHRDVMAVLRHTVADMVATIADRTADTELCADCGCVPGTFRITLPPGWSG